MPLYLNGVETSVGPNIVSPIISGGTIDNCVIGGTTPAAIAGTTGIFSGILSGGLDIIDTASDLALTALQCCGSVIFVSAAATITLAAVSGINEGCNVTIYSTGANAIHVDPADADRIVLDGTALGDGNKLTSASAAGDYITVIKDGAVGWKTIGRSGVWTDGG